MAEMKIERHFVCESACYAALEIRRLQRDGWQIVPGTLVLHNEEYRARDSDPTRFRLHLACELMREVPDDA